MPIDPAVARRSHMENNPIMKMPYLFLGKVVNSNPQAGTIDVALDGALGQGGFYTNVPVLSWSVGRQTGHNYFPTVTLAAPEPSAHGVYDQPIKSGGQDIWAVIGHLAGRSQRPVCIGFMNPLDSQARSNTVGTEVHVHESGHYQVTTAAGHHEIHFPDGGYVIVSTDTAPLNMTADNPKWSTKTSAQNLNLTINVKGNISITVNGTATVNATDVYLGTTTGAGTAVARLGDAVQVNTTTGTGTITSGSSKVFSG